MDPRELRDIGLNHIVEDYFEYTPEERAIMQKFLFMDYVEVISVSPRSHSGRVDLVEKIEEDMGAHLKCERYETVQLYQDTLDRYHKDFERYKKDLKGLG